MKLISCHIDNFGKLSDFHMDFTEGINVIERPNGWGKSTLSAFLKVMFYGFEERKDKSAPDKERKLFFPWQGGIYGGEVLFESKGKQYRISRTFGKTEKGDEYHLYDAVTNLESNDFGDKPGEELFDLDVTSFKRSVYLAQNDVPAESTDGIHAKLGHSETDTGDMNHYEKAQERLKDCLNRLTPDRITGSLKKRTGEIYDLEEELKSYMAAEKAYPEKRKLLEEKTREKEELTAKRDRLAASLEKAGNAENRKTLLLQYEKLCSEKNDAEEKFRQMQDKFPDGLPDKGRMQEMSVLSEQEKEHAVSMQNFRLSEEEEVFLIENAQRYADGIPGTALFDELKEKVSELEKREDRKKTKELSPMEQEKWEEYNSRFAPWRGKNFEQEWQEITDLVGMIKEREDELDEMEKEYLFRKADRGNGNSVIFPLFFVFLAFTCIIVGILKSAFSIPAFFVAGIAMLLGIIFVFNLKKEQKRRAEQLEEMDEMMARMEEDIQEAEERIRNFLEKCLSPCDKNSFSYVLHDLKNLYAEYKKLSLKKEENDASGQEEEISLLSAEIQKELTVLGAKGTGDFRENIFSLQAEAEKYAHIREKKGRFLKARSEREKISGQMKQFLEVYTFLPGEDSAKALSFLSEEMQKYEEAERNYQKTGSEKKEFEEKYSISKLQEPSEDEGTVEEIHGQILDLEKKIEEIRDSLEAYRSQLDDLREQIDLKESKEEELREKQELQEAEKKKYDVLIRTRDFLQTARERFTAKYMAPVSSGFRKYYGILTEGKGQEWQVDANMELKVKEQGEYRDSLRLSCGNRDLIGLCMRLALVDAMYEEEKPFLIMDDPFVNMDDDKLGNGTAFLRKVAEEYQTIYFTCNKARNMI